MHYAQILFTVSHFGDRNFQSTCQETKKKREALNGHACANCLNTYCINCQIQSSTAEKE